MPMPFWPHDQIVMTLKYFLVRLNIRFIQQSQKHSLTCVTCESKAFPNLLYWFCKSKSFVTSAFSEVDFILSNTCIPEGQFPFPTDNLFFACESINICGHSRYVVQFRLLIL